MIRRRFMNHRHHTPIFPLDFVPKPHERLVHTDRPAVCVYTIASALSVEHSEIIRRSWVNTYPLKGTKSGHFKRAAKTCGFLVSGCLSGGPVQRRTCLYRFFFGP